jgi:aminoglycoside phosphotransferase (APT) family kinase protein
MGTPVFYQSRWLRSQPRRSLPAHLLEQIIHAAVPGRAVTEIRPLADGLRNANFRLRLDSGSESFVLRLYEHDASLCQKELDLMRLVGASIPLPEVIHAEPRGLDNCPPFILMRYVEGMTFRDLIRRGSPDAIRQASYSAGGILAEIGRTKFSKSGWIAPGLVVTAPLLDTTDPMPRFVDLCLASPNLQLHMSAELRDRVHSLMWSWASRLASIDREPCLVHGDFNRSNLLVTPTAGCWAVVAILDWEFAIAGSSLNDIGHFLRYERTSLSLVEPYFSTGYLQAGGSLPEEWRRIARLVDLTAICESLTHDDLPAAVVEELVELVSAIVENRDTHAGGQHL